MDGFYCGNAKTEGGDKEMRHNQMNVRTVSNESRYMCGNTLYLTAGHLYSWPLCDSGSRSSDAKDTRDIGFESMKISSRYIRPSKCFWDSSR